CQGLDTDDPAGVEEPGEGAEGSPGTWEIQSSPSKSSARAGRTATSPGPRPRAFARSTGAKRRTHRRYRQAKETKRGGRGGGKSQRPDSTEGEARPLREARERHH